ncbi:hypothetical protein DRO69_00750 [Candidatus Bathyarchaeota archaeon]|nr:MAG: hypothetical protein DRO69_00750 [Candidatus Bathyarchaeota archaeon]
MGGCIKIDRKKMEWKAIIELTVTTLIILASVISIYIMTNDLIPTIIYIVTVLYAFFVVYVIFPIESQI